MLRRLAGGAGSEPLRRLAEVVEPVKLYRRGASREYTQQTPLDRLVDAARPESDKARELANEVERWLSAAPAFTASASLRVSLESWAANHGALDPLLANREPLAEARPLSRNLSRLAALGVEALDHLERRRAPSAEWRAAAAATLRDAAEVHAEVELAVRRPIGRLIVAAELLDRLAELGPSGWLAEIEAALETPAGVREH
jgi:hexosaminidase